MAFEMREQNWEVSFVTWKEYKNAVLQGEGEMWDKFEMGHLIIGGMDFSCDFLYFFFHSFSVSLLFLKPFSKVSLYGV